MKKLYLSIMATMVLVLGVLVEVSNLYSQEKEQQEEASYIIYPQTLTLVNSIVKEISDIFLNTLSLDSKESVSFTIMIKDIIQGISAKELNLIKKQPIENIISDLVNQYGKEEILKIFTDNSYKLLYPIILESSTVQKTLDTLKDILTPDEVLDFLSDDMNYQYLGNLSFLETLLQLHQYTDDSTLDDLIFKNPEFFVKINNLPKTISSLKKCFNEDQLSELFNSLVFLKYLPKNSVDFLKNILFFSKYYSPETLVKKLCTDPESISFKLNKNIPSSIMDNILTIFSAVLSSEEIVELIDIDFFIKLDVAFRTLPKNESHFYRNLKYILILLSKDKEVYLESFPTLISNHFSELVDLAINTEDIYIIEKKMLEFKYNHSISYQLFELNGAYDFVPVFFELFFDNTSSDSPSKYVSAKPYILDTLDSWIEEEYLTEGFSNFLENISTVDSLDLLLVLYVLHNNLDTTNLIKIIKTDPYKLLIFKDFIYTISLYLKDNDLIKKFLSNSTMIINFFNTNWDEETSNEYFKHIITIANIIPEKDRINFILGINTFYPISINDFKAHIELLHLIKDKLKDNIHTVLGSNYSLALNYNELKTLSSDLFLKTCYNLMTKEL